MQGHTKIFPKSRKGKFFLLGCKDDCSLVPHVWQLSDQVEKNAVCHNALDSAQMEKLLEKLKVNHLAKLLKREQPTYHTQHKIY